MTLSIVKLDINIFAFLYINIRQFLFKKGENRFIKNTIYHKNYHTHNYFLLLLYLKWYINHEIYLF